MVAAAWGLANAPLRPEFWWISTLAILLFSAPVIVGAISWLGRRRGIALLVALGLYALVLESLAVATGIPYGRFSYSEVLGPRLFGLAPLTVLLAWTPLILGSLAVTRRAWQAVVLVVVCDLVLDPAAVRLGFWAWDEPGPYYGVPVINFVGWVLSGGLAVLAMRRLPRPLPGLLARNLWLVMVFWTAVNAWSGLWVPAVIGVVVVVALEVNYRREQMGIEVRAVSTAAGTAVVIGGGIGGLASAALLGKRGYEVTLLEKNPLLGGRANYFEADGFRFDMGPSWYLMPDVFEHFFALLGERVSDHLQLRRLDPSYRIAFRGTDRKVDMYSDLDRDVPTFEALEPGSGQALRDYLERSKAQYEIAVAQFMYRNHDNFLDFIDRKTAMLGRELHVFENMHNYISRSFHTDAVQKILEYQLVFLGSSPYNTPALYNIMSHIDFNMGVFYPQGGIYSIIRALEAIGGQHGVKFRTEAPVAEILTEGGRATGVRLESGEELRADLIISNADMHHTETRLLPKSARTPLGALLGAEDARAERLHRLPGAEGAGAEPDAPQPGVRPGLAPELHRDLRRPGLAG